MKAGFMGFNFKDAFDKSVPVLEIVDADILQEFKSQLIVLINEIVNPEVPFTEKI
jgi:hypothetical protein